jgi:putative Holliday junction resolvase
MRLAEQLPPRSADRVRVIGIDLGKRRSGLAVSDELGLVAHPKATVDDFDRLIDTVAALSEETGAHRVVVGLPVGKGGSETEQTKWVRRMAEEISRRLGVEVVLWDERLTTKEARRRLSESGHKSKASRYLADRASAAIILQSYLDASREGGATERDT